MLLTHGASVLAQPEATCFSGKESKSYIDYYAASTAAIGILAGTCQDHETPMWYSHWSASQHLEEARCIAAAEASDHSGHPGGGPRCQQHNVFGTSDVTSPMRLTSCRHTWPCMRSSTTNGHHPCIHDMLAWSMAHTNMGPCGRNLAAVADSTTSCRM